MVGRLVGRLVGWLVVLCLVGWLVGSLVGRLVGRLVGCIVLVGWLVGCGTGRCLFRLEWATRVSRRAQPLPPTVVGEPPTRAVPPPSLVPSLVNFSPLCTSLLPDLTCETLW